MFFKGFSELREWSWIQSRRVISGALFRVVESLKYADNRLVGFGLILPDFNNQQTHLFLSLSN